MRKRSAGIGALVLLTLACVSLAGCGSGGERTRAAGLPTESPVSGLGKLAYELDGVIYVKDLPDGEVIRLTEGSEPRWSPSGQWLLVDDTKGLQWVMRPDGADKHAVPTADAVWSRREDRLAYPCESAIYVENADGSDRRAVASIQRVPIFGYPWAIAWSPDGTRFAYDQHTEPSDRSSSLWVVEVDGRTPPLKLRDSTTDGYVTAGWSADSQYVLYWLDPGFGVSAMNDGIPMYSIPASGGEPQPLTFSLHSGVWESSPRGDPTIVLAEGEGRMTWTGERIALADVSTGRLTYMTSRETASQQPDWSPDGRQIAFVSQPDRGMGSGGPGSVLEEMAKDRRIWVMNSDGSDQRQLTDDPAYRDERPLWSADGSRILFARLDSERHASLWLMLSEGGAPRRVVDAIGSSSEKLTGYYTNIGWSYMYDWWQGPPAPQEQR